MMPDDYIQNHIEIETPHLRETAMTRYEQCWEKLQEYFLEQTFLKLEVEDVLLDVSDVAKWVKETNADIHVIREDKWPVSPTDILNLMNEIEEEICGPVEEEEGDEQ